MSCPKCGQTNRAGAVFCHFCGTRLLAEYVAPRPSEPAGLRIRSLVAWPLGPIVTRYSADPRSPGVVALTHTPRQGIAITLVVVDQNDTPAAVDGTLQLELHGNLTTPGEVRLFPDAFQPARLSETLQVRREEFYSADQDRLGLDAGVLAYTYRHREPLLPAMETRNRLAVCLNTTAGARLRADEPSLILKRAAATPRRLPWETLRGQSIERKDLARRQGWPAEPNDVLGWGDNYAAFMLGPPASKTTLQTPAHGQHSGFGPRPTRLPPLTVYEAWSYPSDRGNWWILYFTDKSAVGGGSGPQPRPRGDPLKLAGPLAIAEVGMTSATAKY